jgi:hypothetical protein
MLIRICFTLFAKPRTRHFFNDDARLDPWAEITHGTLLSTVHGIWQTLFCFVVFLSGLIAVQEA